MRRLTWLFGLALMALMMSKIQAAAGGAALAMAYWYTTVAPSLFPFLALMPLLTSREACRAYGHLLGGVMEKLFGLPGAAAPAMVVGMVSGAPAGAIAARNVAAETNMNQGQLNRLAMVSSGFSPAFLVGGIGGGMLGSVALGWRLLEAQLLTQLTLALLLRRAWRDRDQPIPGVSEMAAEGRFMRGAVMTLLTICGYMALFGALTRVIGEYLGPDPANVVLCLLDVPSGARLVTSAAIMDELRLPVLSAMCGFGGICVIAQSLSALKGCGIGVVEYTSVRVMAGAISAVYMLLLNHSSTKGAGRWAALAHGKPLEMAALIAVAMAVPVVVAIKKSVSNNVKNKANWEM